MFENACLLTVNQKENDVTFIRIRIPMNFFRTFEPCLEYEYYLLSNQLRDTISDQYRTCFQDGFSFLNIGRKENGDLQCSATRTNHTFHFQLPEKAVDFLRHGSGSRSFLCYDQYTYPKMDFTYAQPVLRKIAKIPKARHALCKTLQTSFRWPDTREDHEIRFYPDGGLNFFWREFYGDKPSMCGGLIYSEYNGRSGYSVHT